MAALELGLFPLAQLKRQQDEEPRIHQKKRQRDAMPPGGDGDEDQDDSWEVRAFAEDTSSALGTTWPPRFYACSFCRREFRSAQALGGHMNVHRRDRARAQLRSRPPLPAPGSGRYCFLYPLAAGPGWVGPSAKTLPSASSCFGATDFSMLGDVVKEGGKGVGPDLELRLGRC